MKKKLFLFALVLLMFTAYVPNMVQAADQTTCMAQAKVKNKKIYYSWTKVAGAVKYKVCQTTCGKIKFKCIKVTKGTSYTTKTLKAGVAYKACVVAYDKNGKKIVTSPCVHARTKGKKNLKDSNATKVTATASLTITEKKTGSVKAVIVAKDGNKPIMVDNHAPSMRYYSSNKTVATVSKTGLVTAKAAGTALIYSVAPTGVYAKTKVTVKAAASNTPVVETSKTVTFLRKYYIGDAEQTASYDKKMKAADFSELLSSKTESSGSLTNKMVPGITYGFVNDDRVSIGDCDASDGTDTPIYYEFVKVSTIIDSAPEYLQSEDANWKLGTDTYSTHPTEFKEKYGDCVALTFYVKAGSEKQPVYARDYYGDTMGYVLINTETGDPVKTTDKITDNMKLELCDIEAEGAM